MSGFRVYDPASRLVTESESGTVPTGTFRYSTDYLYDTFGNMTQQSLVRQSISSVPGGDGVLTRATQLIGVDTATNRLSAASYDGAGNMTASGAGGPDTSLYTWDSVGTMRSLTEPNREAHYLYTADDERLAIVSRPDFYSGFKTAWTLRGFDNQVLRTLVDDNSSDVHLWSWSGDEIRRGSSLVADVTTTGTRHFVLDHLGSPRLITDGSATANPLTNDFSSFGTGGTTGSGPLQFTGHERDFGNDSVRTLDYMHARYYSASVGRFLSVDPKLDIDKSITQPQRWNRYTYVVNNPIRFTDPDGRQHVIEPGLTKPLSEADWSDAPPVIKAAFTIEGALLTAAAGEGVSTFLGAMRVGAGMERSIDNPASFTGAKPEQVQQAIPEEWGAGVATKKNGGMRWFNPARRGEGVRVMPGTAGARDPMHAGPYAVFTKNGQEIRVPLAGNPVLQQPSIWRKMFDTVRELLK